MPCLRLTRPSTYLNPQLPWSKQKQYTRWYFRNYAFANFIETPLNLNFVDDPEKATQVFNEAVDVYTALSNFYHNNFPERKFFPNRYIYAYILEILVSYGTISHLDKLNILYSTEGMSKKQDKRTLKKWAKEYEEFVLQNLEKLRKEQEHVLTSYLVIAPPGLNLIKKTD